ncbi:PREDICTED: mitochondrial inner membrane protein OXA1 [Tarenaya hassleriana]|uniref:mitochondrial inner membrane protein OXA1 n=1 Tax=Tarenaya hassleriana TaxID=28532 RepID=UPI00053C1650|nr:PREDICTED: mitochondrial inner membrane protein OXA1 [Tarenaya hassleriana]
MRGCSNAPLSPPLGFALSTACGTDSDEPDDMDDMAEAITSSTLENAASHATLANELAEAASDCTIPVAAAQNLIDMVHSFTGLNWWASIVLTTLLIRGVTIPLMIGNLRLISYKMIVAIRKLPDSEIRTMGMDPVTVTENARRANDVLQKLYTLGGVCHLRTLLIPIQLLIQYPALIAMSLATYAMAGNISSFKTGGALWFTDLATMDASGILPVLSGLTVFIAAEFGAIKGFEGFPRLCLAGDMGRCLAILVAIGSMTLPKAVHCVWITSALFSLISSCVLERPGIKRFLGIPVVSGVYAGIERGLFWFSLTGFGLVCLLVF